MTPRRFLKNKGTRQNADFVAIEGIRSVAECGAICSKVHGGVGLNFKPGPIIVCVKSAVYHMMRQRQDDDRPCLESLCYCAMITKIQTHFDAHSVQCAPFCYISISSLLKWRHRTLQGYRINLCECTEAYEYALLMFIFYHKQNLQTNFHVLINTDKTNSLCPLHIAFTHDK